MLVCYYYGLQVFLKLPYLPRQLGIFSAVHKIFLSTVWPVNNYHHLDVMSWVTLTTMDLKSAQFCVYFSSSKDETCVCICQPVTIQFN